MKQIPVVLKGLPKGWPFDEPGHPKSAQVVVRDRQQVLSDAYLQFALRHIRRQRTIEELKRNCGVK